ncbi:TPA: hypothetical protein ACJ81D_003066, partial [Acinetobacter baumannii]|nr:hypothetical protein [Acinetobacter baumannii]
MISDQLLKVEETDLNFSTLKNEKPLILNRDVSVLILPSVRQNDAFHTGTEEYQELALHSKAHWLGVFLVAQVAVPIFTNVMSDYISNELQAKSDDEIEVNIIIEKNNDKNIKVAYRGKAEHINSVLDKVNELSRDNEVNRHA